MPTIKSIEENKFYKQLVQDMSKYHVTHDAYQNLSMSVAFSTKLRAKEINFELLDPILIQLQALTKSERKECSPYINKVENLYGELKKLARNIRWVR